MIRNFVASAACALMFAGCGGGGGGGGAAGGGTTSGVNIPLTTANYDNAGRAAAAAVADAAATVSTVDTAADADTPVRFPTDMTGLARLFSGMAAYSLAGRDRPQADAQCPGGGSMSFTLNDNGLQGVVDAGDSFSATLTNCIAEVGLPAASGSFTMTFNSATMSGGVVTAASVTLSMINFSSQGTSQTGNVTVSFHPGGGSVQYSGLRSTRAGATNIYNYSATIVSSMGTDKVTYAGTIVLGFNNGIYTLSTPVALTAGATHPVSGTLRLTDAAGGYIELIVAAATFDVDLYLPGDSTRDGHVTYTWADLAAGRI